MPSWPSRLLPQPSSSNSQSNTDLLHSQSASDSRHRASNAAAELPSNLLHGVPSLASVSQASGRQSVTGSGDQVRKGSRHGRSVSHPFTAFLGGSRRERRSDELEDLEPDGGNVVDQGYPMQLSRLSSRKNDPEIDKKFVTGNCGTCDSTVRWPKDLDVYRCTVCLMVNDLKPGGTKKDKEDGDPTSKAGDKFSVHKIQRKAPTLTLDRTRNLVDQCISTYLREKAEHRLTNPILTPNVPVEGSTATGLERSHHPNTHEIGKAITYSPISNDGVESYFHNEQQASKDSTVPQASNPVREPSKSGDPRQQGGKHIFRQMESYLLACMADCDCLNGSFGATRPVPARAASEASALAERPKKSELIGTEVEQPLFEVDAKMLLLGDIGENGTWWAGDRRPSMRKSKDAEASQPAEWRMLRIDIPAVHQWFDAIFGCGKTWRAQRRLLPEAQRIALEWPEEDQLIEQRMTEGRYHVQRTFLKAVENLLRRPGRPIVEPGDSRFLLILLLNPLLYPHPARKPSTSDSHVRAKSLSQTEALQRKSSHFHPKRSGSGARGGATGVHSGIIKRILGLISKSSVECHQSIIAWLCKIPDALFRDVVELINGFVTYRLGRSNGRHRSNSHDLTGGLIPDISGPGAGTSAQLHAALGSTKRTAAKIPAEGEVPYGNDWQVRAAAKVMALVFAANIHTKAAKQDSQKGPPDQVQTAARLRANRHAQRMPTNAFYNTLLDTADLVADFETWEVRSSKFSFCQYPMFLSIWAKIRIMEHDARRQMEVKARDAFFNSIMSRKAISQFLVLKVRRDCLVDDSLRSVSEVVGTGEEEIKKGLRIEFVGEEGVDAGGLRKEWFLLLVREVFDPEHGLFVYDEESNYCYFNPFSFETSDQFFLVGVVLGLAIYNSTILDVALPPFAFRKLLSSAPPHNGPVTSASRPTATHSLDDLAEWKPSLAKGLRQLLDHEGDVEETFCRDFVADIQRYDTVVQVPLCPGGESRPVTNANRREFVNLYVRYLLDDAVARQYEPFKRGFFTVCGGNALSLFRPEEIELLIRGSDEPLDVNALRAVSVLERYNGKRRGNGGPNAGDRGAVSGPSLQQESPIMTASTSLAGHVAASNTANTSNRGEGIGSGAGRRSPVAAIDAVTIAEWFWDTLTAADPRAQRKILAFITGSDRIPAMGATSLVIKVAVIDGDPRRFPTARTCFNQIGFFMYRSREELRAKLMVAVHESEGFGLK